MNKPASSDRHARKSGQPKDDRVAAAVLTLGKRMNRRGFLGWVGKGTAAVIATVAGLGGIGASINTALACVYCGGCRSSCMVGNCECKNYAYVVGGSGFIDTCIKYCHTIGYTRCECRGSEGYFGTYDCPCYATYCGAPT